MLRETQEEVGLTLSPEDGKLVHSVVGRVVNAVKFTDAYEKVKEQCGDLPELHALYRAWMPVERWTYEDLGKLFCLIDQRLSD